MTGLLLTTATAAMLPLAATPLITNSIPIFLTVLVIMLVTPMVLSQLRIPHVIGLILAGVLVGPYGLNLLARDMSFEVFGQVGILYLMFLAGIEIDMINLKKNLRKGLVFGLFTFMIPLVLGAVAAFAFLRQDALSAVLLASMFAAHTLIAYPIVSRFGLSKSPVVVITVAGTIITVLCSLIVVAAVSGVYRDGGFHGWQIARMLGSLVLFCVVSAYVYPRVTLWYFKKYSDGIAQFIYVLAMVFLAATVATWIGIEGIFGAFFAGLLLNRYIPARSRLMNRIEFVGNAIFIPYFLIGVGMLINVGVIVSSWDTIYVAAIMSVVAMAGKWLAAWVTQRRFGMTAVDRSMMYQLSNAHTAVALAVVMIGYSLDIFDENILNGTVVMILVTCTVSSFGTERAAVRMKPQLLMEDVAAQASSAASSRRFMANTLVTVANPLTVPQLVELALFMRGGERAGSNLYALHVRNDNSASSRAIGRNSLDVAEKAASAADARIQPIERYDLNIVTGVLNTVEERDITDLFIGLHRRTNVIDSFFGSKIEQLLKSCNKMVVISRCFIPVNTMTRIVVSVPPKAEYETGFRRWVAAIGNLTQQLGCRVIFCCHPDTRPYIASLYRMRGMTIRMEFRDVEQWDDFVLLANRILDDDLFIVVSARRSSVSYNSDMDMMPQFLQRYFSRNNLILLFPEQFGPQETLETMAEVMSTDLQSAPSPLMLRLMSLYRRASALRRRLLHRRRPDKIDL